MNQNKTSQLSKLALLWVVYKPSVWTQWVQTLGAIWIQWATGPESGCCSESSESLSQDAGLTSWLSESLSQGAGLTSWLSDSLDHDAGLTSWSSESLGQGPWLSESLNHCKCKYICGILTLPLTLSLCNCHNYSQSSSLIYHNLNHTLDQNVNPAPWLSKYFYMSALF